MELASLSPSLSSLLVGRGEQQVRKRGGKPQSLEPRLRLRGRFKLAFDVKV